MVNVLDVIGWLVFHPVAKALLDLGPHLHLLFDCELHETLLKTSDLGLVLSKWSSSPGSMF